MKFSDTNKRTRIPRADLAEILSRQTGIYTAGLRYDSLMFLVKGLCRCECFQGCREPLNGVCEFDHNKPNAISFKGDKIHWFVLMPECHSLKTNGLGGDKARIAKTKRFAFKTTQHDKRLERGRSLIQGGGFQKAPEGHSAWPKRKMNAPKYDNTRYD